MKRLFKITTPVLIVSFIISPLTPLFAEEFTQTPPVQSQQVEMVGELAADAQINPDTPTDGEGDRQVNSNQRTVSATETSSGTLNDPDIVLTPLNISQVSKTTLPNTDSNTGALTYEYPIAVPPGINGLTPSVSLKYNSQKLENSNILGHGWEISIPYIVRKNTHGVDQLYSRNDFTSSEDGDLTLINTTGTSLSFSPQSQTATFNKYTLDTSTNTWTLVTKTGTIFVFGQWSILGYA